MPHNVVQKLNGYIQGLLGVPDYEQRMKENYTDAMKMLADQLADFVFAESTNGGASSKIPASGWNKDRRTCLS
jgi:hypothetical protein